jgi:hypothetical protein
MAINIERIIENALEQAFSRALDQTIQNKAEVLKAFENGSPLAKKLEEKIEQGFQRFRIPVEEEVGLQEMTQVCGC